MGILSKMENDGVCHPVTRGGFISPFGYECINTEGSKYGQVSGCKTYAIKRHIADEYLVKAAKDQETVRVFEGTEVVDAVYNESKNNDETGYYNLVIKDIDSDKIGSIYSSFVLICDGSTSYLGQKLGIIPKSQPAATCSHQYLSEHQWHDSDNQKAADGVMVFNRSVLPGYSALFRHYDSTVYLGTYILPGGRATSRAIPKFEDELTHEHSYVKNALGNSYKVHEKRIVAPIRCGGVPTSYAKQLFLVGDAAGHVDPLTGEGIHTAMIAGQIAAQCIDEMIKAGNFSMVRMITNYSIIISIYYYFQINIQEAMKAYEKRCYDAFGYEFWSSSLCAKIIYNFPIVLDAVCVVGKRRGQSFLDFFGECMTGVRPKSDFVKDASLVAEVAMEMLKQIIIQYIISKKPLIPTKIGMEVVEKIYKSK